MEKISFLIPAYNESKLLPSTLTHLKLLIHKLQFNAEIIVCDNNSTDCTGDIALKNGAQVVFESKNQIARARNRAAEKATGVFFIFIDADTWPSEELLLETVNSLSRKNCFGGGATLRFDSKSLEAKVMPGIWNQISRFFKLAAGSYIFLQREGFKELGGFNENLYAAEELDFSIRAKNLANSKSQTWKIITKYPVMTSSRKINLYTTKEKLKFFMRFLILRKKLFQNPAECGFWYDGKR